MQAINKFIGENKNHFQRYFSYSIHTKKINSDLKDLLENMNDNILVYIEASHTQPTELLKNLLYAFSRKIKEDTLLKVISLRDKISNLSTEFEFDSSIYLEIPLKQYSQDLQFEHRISEIQISDLTKVFDPVNLAESAVGLNLKLMKWRMAPDINLEVLKD